ncbi:MAG: hypothetical protein KGQ37_09000 [Hyphomicrobiales bacterium]|nr:hypothetical protein [Hyphomicrobiales bacterium]
MLAGGVPKLVTTTVSLPDPLRQFPGADAEATWTVEVIKMINAFKAPVEKADVPAIIACLVKHKGIH